MDTAIYLNKNHSLCFNNNSFSSVTERFVIERNTLIAKGKTSNAGIACYICEFICKNYESLKSFSTIPNSCLEHIIREKVDINGQTYWRWEAEPIRDDYYYPIDWDDTCKAIDAIVAYTKILPLDVPISLPKTDNLLDLLYTSIFNSKEAGEDVKIKCKNDLAMYMFIADLHQKPNNAEDIFVTAVTLRTFIVTLHLRNQELLSLTDQLLSRVFEIAEWGLENRIPFSFISRCYLSWGFLLHLLQEISFELSNYFNSCEKLIALYFKKEIFRLLHENKLKPFLIYDELSHAIIISKRNNSSTPIRNDLLKEIHLSNEFQTSFLYRHRRLDHYYGSQYLSKLIRIIATERMY